MFNDGATVYARSRASLHKTLQGVRDMFLLPELKSNSTTTSVPVYMHVFQVIKQENTSNTNIPS
jgi:hypothetical protein